MINGLEGIPGSGKSYEATVFHVLHYLRLGRRVITNLPLNLDQFRAIEPAFGELLELRKYPSPILGRWDADAAGRGEHAFILDSSIQPDPARRDGYRYINDDTKPIKRGSAPLFGNVWDFYSDWHGKDGQGPVFIIDECHVGMPKGGTDKNVIQWYKLHRHYNVDVLLMTQNFRDVCPEIAGLLAMLVKVRKADILGRANSYIRKVHAGYRGAVISTDERKYEKQYFPLYKSHTQGSSVAESLAVDVKPMSVNFRRMTYVIWALGIFGLIGVYLSWSSKEKPKPIAPPAFTKVTPQTPAPIAYAPAPVPAAAASAPVPGLKPTFVSSDKLDPDTVPEPFETKTLHVTGRMTMGAKTIYTFTIAQNGAAVSTVTSRDLERMGYKFAPLTDCSGTLVWKDKGRAITCDLPVTSMAVAGTKPTQFSGDASPVALNNGDLPTPGQKQDGDVLSYMRNNKPTL